MLSQQEGKNARILFFHNIGFFRTLSRVKADIYGISIQKTIFYFVDLLYVLKYTQLN